MEMADLAAGRIAEEWEALAGMAPEERTGRMADILRQTALEAEGKLAGAYQREPFMKMILKLDEEKVRKDGSYAVEDIYEYLNKFALEKNLTVLEDGVYTDSGDEQEDTFSFMLMGGVISRQEWIRFAKEWTWYEYGDGPEDLMKTYEIAAAG